MQSKAATVEEYLAELPPDRRRIIEAVRQIILKNLPKGYEEGMQYGMIGYYVPHSIYPDGYHCDPTQPLPFAGLASQKRHMAIYLMSIYGNPEQETWFRNAWAKTGIKLDMGKSCVRFRKLEDLPLNVIGQAIKRVPTKKLVEYYEEMTRGRSGKRSKKVVTKGKPKKKTPSKRKLVAHKPISASKKSPRKALAKKTTRKKTATKKMASNKRHTVAKATVQKKKKKTTARSQTRRSTKR